jgi:heat shock protein HslJ
MKRHSLLLVLASIATVVGACSSGASGSSAPSAPPSSSAAPSAAVPGLDGKTYLSTDVKGVTMVPGTRIRMAFKDNTLSASGGCNSMHGAYTVTGDRLSAPMLAMTEMACAEPLMQQDQWLARLLGGATIALAGDTLTLDDGTVRLTMLDREVASPDKPIEGTTWVLDGIVTGDAVSSVPTGVTASMRIVDGRVEVDAGCNTGGGPVTVTADTLAFGPMMLTKKACTAGPGTVEGAVVGTLTGTVNYTIDADVLTIDAGKSGLVFRAAP